VDGAGLNRRSNTDNRAVRPLLRVGRSRVAPSLKLLENAFMFTKRRRVSMTQCVACLTHHQCQRLRHTLVEIASRSRQLTGHAYGWIYRRGFSVRSVRLIGLPAFATYAIAVDPYSGAGGLPCVWRMLSGLNCPGCGLSRASALLLRGHLAEAIAMNVLILPVAGIVFYSFIRQVATELAD
jgi:hypothetical protein